MRLTLDWDDVDDKQRHLDTVRDRYEGYPWELRRSSSGDGWHLIVYELLNDTDRAVKKNLNLRDVYDDDPKRRNLDAHRWGTGSPFFQVLYQRKYMERNDWPAADGTGYSTGHNADVVEQSRAVKAAPKEEQVKDPDTGRLDYAKLLNLVRDRTGLTQGEVADKTHLKTYAKEDGGISRSTVSAYERGERNVSADSLKRWLRRTARSRGIGHYAETSGGGQAAEEVRWIDPEDERRTLVEYVDVPLDFDIGEEDREYGLLNIHTGTFNDAHTDQQIHRIHDGEGHKTGVEKAMSKRGVADQALAVLSPTNPQTGTELRLDDRNETFAGISGWTRELDSLNYERELLDDDEADVYVDNLPSPGKQPDNPANYPIFEVILWDENMDDMEWQVIGLWTGSDPSEATILLDRGIGNWNAA